MKKLFVEAEVEITLLSAIDDMMAASVGDMDANGFSSEYDGNNGYWDS